MKITKKELFKFCDENNDAINELQSRSDNTDFLLAVLIQQLKDSGVIDEISPEPKPQLKQLDQSIFDGLEKQLSVMQTQISSLIECAHNHTERLIALEPDNPFHGKFYKPERDTAKELLEVDLSSELTGSELCKAMINRGDKIVLCIVRDYEYEDDIYYDAITHCSGNCFESSLSTWSYAIPINNQGEPLTAAEAGL